MPPGIYFRSYLGKLCKQGARAASSYLMKQRNYFVIISLVVSDCNKKLKNLI